MQFRELALPGAYEITLAPAGDARGYFMRAYHEDRFRERGLTTAWVADNQSRTALRHTLRGLHFQRPPHAETKLVRVVQGAILDVLVDLRTGSPTRGQHAALELSADNQRAAYVPKGFAHGFCTLTDDVVVLYKVDAHHAPASEGGLAWDDPELAIPWPTTSPILSERDGQHPRFGAFASPF